MNASVLGMVQFWRTGRSSQIMACGGVADRLGWVVVPSV